MEHIVQKVFQKISLGWSANKWVLVGSNFFLAILLIVLLDTGLLPLNDVNFVFLAVVLLLSALYRPAWIFLFCVGLLPFETVNLAPQAFGFEIRPYQLLVFALFFALLIRFFLRKQTISLFRLRLFDYALLLIPLGAVLASFFGPDPGASLRQAGIIFSFGLLYLLVRLYVKSVEDARQILPFVLSSSLVVFGYALWQNMRFFLGQNAFTVMEGRPNATFSEADWLGMFCLFIWALLLMLLFQFFEEHGKSVRRILSHPNFWLILLFQVLASVVLLVAVSRSAWLGVILGGGALFVLLGVREKLQTRGILKSVLLLFSSVFSGAVAILLTAVLHLTPFPLLDRAQSTGSGLQEITASCESDVALPEKIESIEALQAFGCRHIRLEDVSSEASAGRFIKETRRPDPNVAIRGQIYGKTLSVLREHWLFGIGWGSISEFLGTDERGAGLNASNMFLEIWLGSGPIAFIAFLLFWFGSLGAAFFGFLRARGPEASLFLFVLASGLSFTVFNLFNSGILLGFFFLFLGFSAWALENTSLPEWKPLEIFKRKGTL